MEVSGRAKLLLYDGGEAKQAAGPERKGARITYGPQDHASANDVNLEVCWAKLLACLTQSN